MWLGGAASATRSQTPVAALAHAALAGGAPRNTLLVVGDSLSAEYGLKRGSGWVALLEQRLLGERFSARVVNASISGDTSSGGLSRLPALLLQHRPTQVILELGGNDALRGLALADTQRNLTQMAQAARAAGARVLIVGIQIPPNYGRRYNDELAALFVTVARNEGSALVPFLLKDVPDALFQADRIHPLEAGHPTMLANVWPALKPLLR
ncbi:MAG: arylesterase [Pseudomonadota bacterium]|nr:arylesterase [Pseudomonadota bacterium]